MRKSSDSKACWTWFPRGNPSTLTLVSGINNSTVNSSCKYTTVPLKWFTWNTINKAAFVSKATEMFAYSEMCVSLSLTLFEYFKLKSSMQYNACFPENLNTLLSILGTLKVKIFPWQCCILNFISKKNFKESMYVNAKAYLQHFIIIT